MNDKLVTPTPESEAFEQAFDKPRQYRELADVFGEGDLQVWYLKPEFAHSHGSFGEKPDPTNLKRTHVLLGSISPTVVGGYRLATLDEMWVELQGERWSPKGEARELIASKGLIHTSMSVGDCFVTHGGGEDSEVFYVAPMGFDKLD
jgi:hypothetical protein